MLSSLCRLLSGRLLFFAGITLLRKGLRHGTGTQVEKTLRRLTPKPVSAVIVGTLVTCVMQSSSAVTVMTIGLVDSGILMHKFWIIMGANQERV